MRGPGLGNTCNDRKGTNDYTCMEEVTTEVVTIEFLPGGFGQDAQKLPEPIEVIKTKVVDVGDDLRKREYLQPKMISSEKAADLVRSGKFSRDMMPKKPRACKGCGGDLPKDRHWHCRECIPMLPDDAGQFEYCGVAGE